MPARIALLQRDLDLLIRGDHLVLEVPACASAQLRHHDVAIAQHVHVEIDMRDRRARDVDLRHVRGEVWHDFRDGRDFQRGANHDDQIDEVFVVVGDAVGEAVGERFSKEGDVRFHDARLGVVVVIFGGAVCSVEVEALFLLVLTVVRALTLHGCRGSHLARVVDTSVAVGDPAGTDVGEDEMAVDLVTALYAAGGGEGPVALDQLFGKNAGSGLDVVNVLRVVGEEFAFLLQEVDEGVSRGEPVG